MPTKELLEAPMQREERRILIEPPLPDGRVLQGGIRALVRAVVEAPT